MVVAKIGERTYEFASALDLADARETFANCFGDQNKFETEMEEAGIDFAYDIQDLAA